MELIEFLFGIGITIIGVVIVEIIANYYREKKDNNEKELQRTSLWNSLGIEVAKNGDILAWNVNVWKAREKDNYFLFQTVTFNRIITNLDPYYWNLFKKEDFTGFTGSNTYCEEFNRRYGSNSGQNREEERKMLNEIGYYLNKCDKKIEPPNLSKEDVIS